MPPRPYVLMEANYRQLLEEPPTVAILPWGATEAHNYHLPHGTDVMEARAFAERSAALAREAGGRVVVLPAIPFGNDAQQLDQVATVHLSTATARGILWDVAHSLRKQGVDRLVVLNAHGGNDFKPLIRDLIAETGMLVVLANFYQMRPEETSRIFADPGDHAGELETSVLLHFDPTLVELERAGAGTRRPFEIEGLDLEGVWTPRPWSQTHPDTGSGDPSAATAEKGREYFETVAATLSRLLVGLTHARKGDHPYL